MQNHGLDSTWKGTRGPENGTLWMQAMLNCTTVLPMLEDLTNESLEIEIRSELVAVIKQ